MRKILILVAFLATLLAPEAFAQAVQPGGCPNTSQQLCSVPAYVQGIQYALNQLVSGSDGNIYRSLVPNNVADPAASNECGTAWSPAFVWFARNLTNGNSIVVPTKCPTVAAAISWLQPATLLANVQIHPVDNTYNFPGATISLNHPFGRMIDIIGNTTTPANVVFSWPGINVAPTIINDALFEMTNGNGFGTIDGIRFVGPGCGGTAPACTNAYQNSGFVMAQGSGASVTVGPHVFFVNGYYGVHSREGARIVADQVDCSGGGDGCVWAYNASLSAMGAKLHDAVAIFAGAGALCDNFSYCEIDGAFLYSNQHGLSLFNNSAARVNGTSYGAATFGKDAGGTAHTNTFGSVQLANSSFQSVEGSANYFDGVLMSYRCTNYIQGGPVVNDANGGTQLCALSNFNYTSILIGNNSNNGFISFQKTPNKAFSSSANSSPNTDPMLAMQTTNGTRVAFGTNNLMAMYLDTDQSANFLAPIKIGTTKFTVSGCSATTTVGNGSVGRFTSGTTGTCTAVITLNGATGMTAPNGWACYASDRTTPANLISQTADNATTATIAGTTVSGDVISFGCLPY